MGYRYIAQGCIVLFSIIQWLSPMIRMDRYRVIRWTISPFQGWYVAYNTVVKHGTIWQIYVEEQLPTINAFGRCSFGNSTRGIYDPPKR
jgi:hypothetical protein